MNATPESIKKTTGEAATNGAAGDLVFRGITTQSRKGLGNYQPLIDFAHWEAAMDFEIHRWAAEQFDKEFRLMKEKLGEA